MSNEVNIKQILEAQLSNNKKELFESSLSRIMSHVNNAKNVGFALLTSWRKQKDKPTNFADFSSLKNFIKNKGLGYLQLRGHWRECQDPNVSYENCPESELEDSVEPSLFVIGIDLPTAVGLGETYNQDAILYAGPETGGNVQLHFKDGSTLNLGEFNPMTVGQAFTEYRIASDKNELGKVARYFTFEGLSYPAQSFVEKLTEQQLLKNMKRLQEGINVTGKLKLT